MWHHTSGGRFMLSICCAIIRMRFVLCGLYQLLILMFNLIRVSICILHDIWQLSCVLKIKVQVYYIFNKLDIIYFLRNNFNPTRPIRVASCRVQSSLEARGTRTPTTYCRDPCHYPTKTFLVFDQSWRLYVLIALINGIKELPPVKLTYRLVSSRYFA